jgi:hypothetical protein
MEVHSSVAVSFSRLVRRKRSNGMVQSRVWLRPKKVEWNDKYSQAYSAAYSYYFFVISNKNIYSQA